MRHRWIAAFGLFSLAGMPFAQAATCTDRGSTCVAACTQRQVDSGVQFGGTVADCRKSCQSRLRSCLKTGTWIHMTATRRGEQERVDRE